MKPLLSVCIITYNHKDFIREALESALNQQVTFPYEIVLSDDHSTDGTGAICLEYSQRFPERIRLLEREKNVGAIRNFYSSLEECRGEYIALLEGDDYWSDPQKLEKQLGFLKNNPDFAICFHQVQLRKGAKLMPDTIVSPPAETTTIRELAWGNYIHTPSCVFRNYYRGQAFPEFVYQAPLGDYVLHMLNARQGKIKYMKEVMAVYRVHEQGMWRPKSKIERWKMWLTVVELLLNKFGDEIDDILKLKYQTISLKIYQQLVREGAEGEESLLYLMAGTRYNHNALDALLQENIAQVQKYQHTLVYKISYRLSKIFSK